MAKRKKVSRAGKSRSTRKTQSGKLGYGWLPDLPDHRDLLYGQIRPAIAPLPSSMDLRPTCSPVENQGQLGSCTANALVGALEFLEKKDGMKLVDLSRLFIYYDERAVEHTVKSDSGAQIRDGIKTLAKQGVCPEKEWPYNVAKFAAKPSAKCYKDALQHVITSYQRILTLDEMRSCLAGGFPFVFGFTVYESFESQQVAQTGILNMPQPGEKVMGGHAVVAVGYDDSQKRFIIRNSWGASWGQRGYFTMPYDYLADRNLSDDIWTIRRGEHM
ncbi:MAG TPA: C1 family peptidase [Candidatus Acidoferrales bacterium]|nr:C1 family peptidase [Candidatus Acidoferrales bacterium]